MDKTQIIQAVKKAREGSPKRNFLQRFDFIANLQDIDIKKPDEKIDLFVTLPHGTGKDIKICAFVDDALISEAKKEFYKAIHKDECGALSRNKPEMRRLAKECDFFVAQANLMPDIASNFGKILGPKGKMPNPKAGCIIPPKAQLKPLKERLKKLVRLQTKNEPIVKCLVGSENMDDAAIVDNILAVHTALVHALPKGEANIKSMFLKLTMGKPSTIGAKKGGEGK